MSPTTRRAEARRRRRSLVASSLVLSSVLAAGAGAGAVTVAAAEARDIGGFACPADRISSPFTDTGGNVHEDAIDCLSTYGITTGTTPTHYSPGTQVTRGQMATFLYRILDTSGVEMDTADRGFTDVGGNVHEKAINGIASIRVANGTTPTTFSPDAPITRAQFATLLAGAIVRTGAFMDIGPDAFDDDDGNIHEPYIDALATNGISVGVAPGRYDPNGNVRRDAMASFLMRAVDFGIEHGGVTSFFEDDERLTAMTPEQVSNGTGGEADATGSGRVWTIGQPDVVCMAMVTRDIGSGVDNVEMGAYLARGARGAEGEVLVEFPPPTPADHIPFEAAHASVARCVHAHPDVVSDVVQRPEGLYLGLATFEHPEAIRGQLGAVDQELVADLTGAAVVPGPGDPDGVGAATVTTTSQADHLCWTLEVEGVDTASAAHVHTGAEGVSGPPVVTLAPTPADDGLVAWCTAGVDPAVLAAIEASPATHHVDVHTSTHPNGAIRGQLEP